MRLLLCACLAVGCSSSTTSGGPIGDASTLDDSHAAGDSGTTTTPIDSTSSADDAETTADAARPVPSCQMTCSSASDCVQTGAAFDADNYACDAGICRYKGCNTDAECTSTFASDRYGCRDIGGIKQCAMKCAAPADCATPGSAPFDTDNWSCGGGTCRYLGCKSDSECSAIGASYVCRLTEGLLVPTCQKSCAAPSDCATASAAYDADNYACESGVCKYIGCKSDEECRSSLMKPNYACR